MKIEIQSLPLVAWGSSAHTSWSGSLQTGQGEERQCTADKLPFLGVRIAAKTACRQIRSLFFINELNSVFL